MRSLRNSKALQTALAETGGSINLVGMGQQSDGEKFARKMRIDLQEMPLLVDSGPPFMLYRALQLRNEASLVGLYANTVTTETFFSAARGLLEGGLPTYDSGGSLTQLGGTFVVSRKGLEEPQLVYEHIDKQTGVHAPMEELCAAVRDGHV